MVTIRSIVILFSFNGKIVQRMFILIIGLCFILYLTFEQDTFQSHKIVSNQLVIRGIENNARITYSNLSAHVHVVNLTATINVKFKCIKTRKLLSNLSTHICLHQTTKDKYVSGAFKDSVSIWEGEQVTRILELLVRHPHLHFIDMGANIGTYTMYVATLGRFVLAIDCFEPNLVRLTRAIQLANVTDRVVLVQNALFTQSGQFLRLSVDTTNIGGQSISLGSNYSVRYHINNHTSTKNPYIVKTITFDDVLPILLAHGIESVVMKIDIEGSESFVIESGSRVFDRIDIPLIQMEWKIVRLHNQRMKLILDFFSSRHYQALTSACQLLHSDESRFWPDEIYWLKENTSNFC